MKSQFPSIKCPQCAMVSYHPEDIKQKFCANCDEWHSSMSLPVIDLSKLKYPIIKKIACRLMGHNFLSTLRKTQIIPNLGFYLTCKRCGREIFHKIF